ncbi:MAG: phospholipase D-like domain-containing protein [Sumerlaeia bacterium]
MAKFLNTSATTYHLEELIKQARERLILISPFLRFNERIRELLEDQNRLKIDIRVVYGKSELQPEEIAWLKSLEFVRLSFCKNLHAKCYLNEQKAIVTSMNLYEFSQVNNNEMGILMERDADGPLFLETYQEAQRLIRVSEEVKLSVERVSPGQEAATAPASAAEEEDEGDSAGQAGQFLSTTRLAKSLDLKPKDLFTKLQEAGWIDRAGDKWVLTAKGKEAGGETRFSRQYGEFIVWPTGIRVP